MTKVGITGVTTHSTDILWTLSVNQSPHNVQMRETYQWCKVHWECQWDNRDKHHDWDQQEESTDHNDPMSDLRYNSTQGNLHNEPLILMTIIPYNMIWSSSRINTNSWVHILTIQTQWWFGNIVHWSITNAILERLWEWRISKWIWLNGTLQYGRLLSHSSPESNRPSPQGLSGMHFPIHHINFSAAFTNPSSLLIPFPFAT